MKKLTALLLILVMIFASFSVFGEETPESMELSLDKAKEIALANNSSIQANELNITKAKISMDDQKAAYDKAVRENEASYNVEMLKIKKGYYYRTAQMGYNLALLQMEQTKDAITFSVESQYFNMRNQIDYLSLLNDSYELSKSNYEKVKKRYELGTIPEIEYISAGNQLDTGKYNLDKASRDLELMRIKLCDLLGLDTNTKLNLTTKLETSELTDFDLDTAMNNAAENRLEVVSAKEQFECDKLDFAATKGYYTPNTYKYKSAEHNLLISENNIKLAENNVRMNIRTLYNTYLDAAESLPLNDKLISQQETNLTIITTKFENGMCTYDELMQAENAVKEAKLNRAQSVLNLNIAIKQLEYAQKTGLGSAQ